MQLENRSLDFRVKKHKEDLAVKIAAEIEAQKVIDTVVTRPFLSMREAGTIQMYVNMYETRASITFNIDEVELEPFIEQVLGPLHRQYGWDWVLQLEGEEKDPVFNFSNIKANYEPISWIWLKVKEGAFKSCTVRKMVKEIKKSDYTTYTYEMECM